MNWTTNNIFAYRGKTIQNPARQAILGTDGRGRWFVRDIETDKFLIRDEQNILIVLGYLNQERYKPSLE